MLWKRDPEAWNTMQRDLKKVDKKIYQKDSLEVRMAMETVRTGILLNAMPVIQRDLWDNLSAASAVTSKYGHEDLVKSVYEKSTANLADLLDLLYVADQLAHKNPAVSLANMAFFQTLLDLLNNYRGVQMDELIGRNFSNEFQSIDRYLLGLSESNSLIKNRLNHYSKLRAAPKKRQTKTAQMDELQDWRGTVRVALENLESMNGDLTEHESATYLMLLQDLGMEFDNLNLFLLDGLQSEQAYNNHLAYLLKRIQDGHGRNNHASAFDSVVASMLEHVSQDSLKALINSNSYELFNERLLALSMLRNADGVDEKVIMELMLESDRKDSQVVVQARAKLRNIIRNKGFISRKITAIGLEKRLS